MGRAGQGLLGTGVGRPRWDLASSAKLNSAPAAKPSGSGDLRHDAPICTVWFGLISGNFGCKRLSLIIHAGTGARGRRGAGLQGFCTPKNPPWVWNLGFKPSRPAGASGDARRVSPERAGGNVTQELLNLLFAGLQTNPRPGAPAAPRAAPGVGKALPWPQTFPCVGNSSGAGKDANTGLFRELLHFTASLLKDTSHQESSAF